MSQITISQKRTADGTKNLNGNPGNLKTNQEAEFIFRMKNIGKGIWPDDTHFQVIEYDRAPFN